jgi:hypothetical protein
MNCCLVYPTSENEEGSRVYFSCNADGEYSECNYTDGYKNRCPHKNQMDCDSIEANLDAAVRAKKEMVSIIKALKAKTIMDGRRVDER